MSGNNMYLECLGKQDQTRTITIISVVNYIKYNKNISYIILGG